MLVALLRAHPGAARSPEQDRAVNALLSCRTAARGGHLYRCGPCAKVEFAYHSCHHRACPNCGGGRARDWLEERKLRLLPVPYFLLTFTVPEELRALFLAEPKFFYDRLFAVTSQALRDVALSKLGGEPAALGVLHTWSRQLVFHPHVHYIVPGGFLSGNRLRWIRLKDPKFLLPEKVLSRRARSLLRAALAARPDLLARVPAAVWRKEWIVNTQPVGSGEKALGYLAHYVQRTALSSQRLLKEENGRTTFQYRASDTGAWKLMTLDTPEFLRRFLQHVLPAGFHRGALLWLVESGGDDPVGACAGAARLEGTAAPSETRAVADALSVLWKIHDAREPTGALAGQAALTPPMTRDPRPTTAAPRRLKSVNAPAVSAAPVRAPNRLRAAENSLERGRTFAAARPKQAGPARGSVAPADASGKTGRPGGKENRKGGTGARRLWKTPTGSFNNA